MKTHCSNCYRLSHLQSQCPERATTYPNLTEDTTPVQRKLQRSPTPSHQTVWESKASLLVTTSHTSNVWIDTGDLLGTESPLRHSIRQDRETRLHQVPSSRTTLKRLELRWTTETTKLHHRLIRGVEPHTIQTDIERETSQNVRITLQSYNGELDHRW